MSEERTAAGAVDRLAQSVDALGRQVAELTEVGNQRYESLETGRQANRRSIRTDRAAGAVAVAAVLVAVFAVWTSAVTRASVAAVHQSNIAGCQTGNVLRQQQGELWTYILGLIRPPPHATPAQVRQAEIARDALAARVHVTFAPRDCAALYRLTGGPAVSPSAPPR